MRHLIVLLMLFMISCNADKLVSESESAYLSNPPTKTELCELQSFLLGHGYRIHLDTIQLPREFNQPLDNVLGSCR